MTFDTAKASTVELFSTYRAILRELRDRTVVRTGNAPTGDYAEWLAARHLGGELARNSEKSFDVTGPDGRTYQVKSRMVDGTGQGKRQLSPFRSWEFDDALIVLFNDDYSVMRASIVPRALVKEASTHREHVNGHVAFATDDLMDSGKDVTAALKAVAGEADSWIPPSDAEPLAASSGGDTHGPQPAKFHGECAKKASAKLGMPLHHVKGNTFASIDGNTTIICFTSKRYEQPTERYWFGFYSYQQKALEAAASGYLVFGCGSPDTTFLIPAGEFTRWLDSLSSKPYSGGGSHWQVLFEKEGTEYELRCKADNPRVPLSRYLLAGST